MDALVEIILICVTLGIAILGTASNPGKNIKIAIISLAVLTSMATGYQFFSNAEENYINKKLIVSLVQSSNQPPYFSHDLAKSLGTLPKISGKRLSQKVFEESGERIFTLYNVSDDQLSGVLYISWKAMNSVYYAYAVDNPVEIELEKILSRKWTDCESHWNQCFNELSAIVNVAMESYPIETSEITASFDPENLEFQLSFIETYSGKPVSVVLDGNFIESLYGLSPIQRGLKILEQGQLRIIENLDS